MLRLKLFAVLIVAALSVGAFAAPAPKTVGFMGILNTAQGAHSNGSVGVALALYTAAAGGSPVWTETQVVSTSNGLFSTALGLYNPLSGVDFSQALFVGITVQGDAQELTPRIPLQGVPYALFAQGVADGSVSAGKLANEAASLNKVSGGVMTSLGSGGATPFIGIGTTAPVAKLDVRGNIALGTTGQYRAVAAGTPMRIVAGIYNLSGPDPGYTIVKQAVGHYTITFTNAFNGYPAVTVTPYSGLPTFGQVNGISDHSVDVFFYLASGALTDPGYFFFNAIGA